MKDRIRLVSLIVLLIFCGLSCNAEWIDKTGNFVEGPIQVRPESRVLSEGMAVFGPEFLPMKGGKQSTGTYGFRISSGEVVIQAKFLQAGAFHDALAPVFYNHKWFYIDKKGKTAIKLPAGCSFAGEFNDGRAAIVLRAHAHVDERVPRSGDRLGYIDVKGQQVISAKYRFVFARDCRFSEGLASVIPGDCVLLNYGYIDRQGEWVIKPNFQKASPFNAGKAYVTVAKTEFKTESFQYHDSATGYTRERQFQNFLATHHLIGLSKNSVQKYLGSPDSVSNNMSTYALENNCTTALLVELFYNEDVVTKYRYKRNTGASNWIENQSDDHSEFSQYVN